MKRRRRRRRKTIGNRTFPKCPMQHCSLFTRRRTHFGFRWSVESIVRFLKLFDRSLQDDYDAGYLYHCQFGSKDDRFQYNPERQDAVIATLPVPNTDLAHGDDIPLTTILIR